MQALQVVPLEKYEKIKRHLQIAVIEAICLREENIKLRDMLKTKKMDKEKKVKK